MKLRPLIDASSLADLIRQGNVLVVDCRFDLADPARGARDHAQGHIPGAVYADLNRDLSDLSKPGPNACEYTTFCMLTWMFVRESIGWPPRSR